MHRLIGVLLAGALAFTTAPARADSVTGFVMLPTYESPTPGRLAYWTGSQVGAHGAVNGMLAHVFRLTKTSGPFTLTAVGGLTTLEDFGIVFYGGMDGAIQPAVGPAMCVSADKVCTGTIPAGAQWAVVTLSVGFAGQFRYTS